MDDETVEQVAQINCAYPIPGSVQSQVGCSFRQPDAVKDTLGREGGGLDRRGAGQGEELGD